MTPVRPCMASILAATLLVVILAFVNTADAGTKAKSIYMTADAYHQKLKNSPTMQKKVSAWLTCIKKYKTVYRRYPADSWAPAGMFKAAELYFQLYTRSGSEEYRSQSLDLASRITKKYPQSAYNGRAKILIKAIDKTTSPTALAKVPTLKSKKAATRDDNAIARYKAETLTNKNSQPLPKPADTTNAPDVKDTATVQLDPIPSPNKVRKKDTHITNLQFWSNPEYTRIVVSADNERPYSHSLLKQDPAHNIPFQRLYVDIEQARLGKAVAEHTPINDDLLKQARAGQYQPHTVRVVVDIKSFENYKIFSLKDPFRIVIDVWGKDGDTQKMDKLLTTLKKEKSTASSPSSSSDTVEKPDPITTDNLKSSDIARQLALGVRKIVIDPGHGGKDPGAPGFKKGVWEKDIVLKLSKNLAAKLRKRLKCKVLLTRETDKKLSLEARTAIANTEGADLFISMHCNAARNKKLSGIETYILNLATDDQAIAVAARENATSEKNISDLKYILSDLMQHAKIEESTRLANDVQKSMIKGMRKKYSKINDLGVKQAPFYVLLGARMPSILIEASFISNQRECDRLMTKSYRDAICTACLLKTLFLTLKTTLPPFFSTVPKH